MRPGRRQVQRSGSGRRRCGPALDPDRRRVLRLIETDIEHPPEESGDYLDSAYRGPERTDLKPISIAQPEGVSFTLEDGVLAWQNWKVPIGFNGLNYGQPGPMHGWQNYFDTGECQFGRLANHLELGCDCLGEITYVDAVVVDDLDDRGKRWSCRTRSASMRKISAPCGSTPTSTPAPGRPVVSATTAPTRTRRRWCPGSEHRSTSSCSPPVWT